MNSYSANGSQSGCATTVRFWRDSRDAWLGIYRLAKGKCLPTEAALALDHAKFAQAQVAHADAMQDWAEGVAWAI